MRRGWFFVLIFTRGQGNLTGNPIVPLIKLSSNALTVAVMSEPIDVVLAGLLRFKYNLAGAADRTVEMLTQTIDGRLTAVEVLRYDKLVLTKRYRSA
jgi:altronate dehydratase